MPPLQTDDCDVPVLVIGAGAAGLAAAARLREAGVACRVLEGRDRIGGRAFTAAGVHPEPLDLGCAWLHSGDVNPWTAIAEAEGFTVDRAPPRWGEQAGGVGFAPGEIDAFNDALDAYFAAIEADPDAPDVATDTLLDPAGRWTPLVDAVNTWVSGTPAARTSRRDAARYADTEVNWRVREGYGALVARHAAGLDVRLGTRVTAVDHGGRRLRVETDRGALTAAAVVVTLPTAVLADGSVRFTPDLPEKRAAAAGLPLGVADKLFLAVGRPDLLPDGHAFGRTDRRDTGSYHLKVFGRPVIECYFGGDLAVALEDGGPAAFAAFALDELAGLYGGSVRAHLAPVVATAWARDPFSGGSYSSALPGHADDRAVLAAPVDGRLFFAGEAVSRHDFSTCHGAYRTGRAAAEAALAALGHDPAAR